MFGRLTAGAHREAGALPGWLLVSFLVPLLLVGVLSLWVERTQFDLSRQSIEQEAKQAGMAYGAQISARLMTHFAELEFVAVELIGNGANPTEPDEKTVQTLRRFIKTHPGVYSINVQSADGDTVLWSTSGGTRDAIFSGRQFTALPGNPNQMFGSARFVPRFGYHLLATRYRLKDRTGDTRFFVGIPYRLDNLLSGGANSRGWTFTTTDTRTHDVIGRWSNGAVRFGIDRPDHSGVFVDIPGYPLAVQVTWPAGGVRERYLQAAPIRWAFELGALLLLILAAYWVITLLNQRARDTLRLQRLSDFNALLAQVNRVVAESASEKILFQAICDLAIRYAHLKLAWVGRPDSAREFQFIAASGDASYVAGLVISSDPTRPEGQGPAGRTWREGRAYYNENFEDSPILKPWQSRARQWGLRANATLPIFRQGAVVAVLAVFHRNSHIWDHGLRQLLEELARAISNGLDRVEAAQRKHELELDLERTHAFQRTLFEKNAAGIFLMDPGRLIVDVNTSLCQMMGYAPEALIGRSLSVLYADDERPFEEFARYSASEIRRKASIQLTLPLRRRNGEVRIMQALGTAITLPMGVPGLLCSVIDITALQDAREQVQRQAMHDILTDLPNRRALEMHLPLTIARAQRRQGVIAVGMMDLDNFKPVNDTWGHEAGDRLLIELAARLRSHMRETDLLVRLGGDEFVIVIDDLDADQATAQLGQVLARLHHAVETPFQVSPDAQAIVGMSLGVALYPFDGKDGDSLIRLADAAMYRAKQNKQHRVNWWQPSVAETAEYVDEAVAFDAYGPDAVGLLNKAQPYVQIVTEKFIGHFYTELSKEPLMHEILRNFTPEQVDHLMGQQAAYLRFLLAPSTTQAMIHERARQIGQIHALVGVSAVLLTQTLSLYRRLLSDQLKEYLLPARIRYQLLQTAEARLQEDLEIQLDMGAQTLSAYFDHLSLPLPPSGTGWTQASTRDIDRLGSVPGIQGALLMRLNAQGVFTVESSAGPIAEQITSLLRQPGFEAVIDPALPQGQGLSAQAWRNLQIMSSPSYAQDTRYAAWHDVVEGWGIRSTLSVPIQNPSGQAEAVISLFGAFPNQFESTTLQHFARGLQQRWEHIWQRCTAPSPVISEVQAVEIRRALFSGGLRMYVQPVVSLSTGALVKVEALARLCMPDGQIILPGVFLPLLGQAELDHLFRLGLVASLTDVARWDAAGLSIDIAVNLPPSNLLDDHCPRWVADALRRHDIPPERLTLELLENQSIDPARQDRTIAAFLDIGVKLAMDDLGSGYSSLLRLSQIPFHTIKIDQGLMVHIRENPVQGLSLIASILQMGRDFDRVVVAEGLEDFGMIEAVAQLGAQFGQGYGIAHPMPPDALPHWRPSPDLRANPQEIRTFLGALAHQWRVMHEKAPTPVAEVTANPLTHFLRDRAQDAAAAHWYAQIRAPSTNSQQSAQLLNWLAEQVRREQA